MFQGVACKHLLVVSDWLITSPDHCVWYDHDNGGEIHVLIRGEINIMCMFIHRV